jgi:hypothetical protein
MPNCRSCLYWNNGCTYTDKPTVESCNYTPLSSPKGNKGMRIWRNKKNKAIKKNGVSND